MTGFTIVHLDDFERPFPKWALARRSLGLQSFGMNVVELPPGETIPEHDEASTDQEEVFIVLSGDATMMIDETEEEWPDDTARARLAKLAAGRVLASMREAMA